MQTLQRQHLPPRPSPPRFPWPRLERPPRRRSPSPARRRLRTAMKVNGTAAARPTPPMTTTQLQVNLQNSRAKSFSPDPSLFTIYLRSTSPKLSFKLKISESARRVVILDIRWSTLCLSAFFFFLILRHSSSLSCVKCWHFMILRGGNGNMKNSPSSFLFPVLLLLSHIIKNPQLCFSVRSRTEKVKKTKKPASSGFFFWICVICWVSKLRADSSRCVVNVSASVWVRANPATSDPSLTVPSVSSRRRHSGRPHHGLNARWGRNLLPCLLFSSFIHPSLLLWSPHLSVLLVSFFSRLTSFTSLLFNFKVEPKLYKRMYK